MMDGRSKGDKEITKLESLDGKYQGRMHRNDLYLYPMDNLQLGKLLNITQHLLKYMATLLLNSIPYYGIQPHTSPVNPLYMTATIL
jgi:hypothetical protein